MLLKGRSALVTGAAKRVGKEIALELARSGCHILLHYHTSGFEAGKTSDEIRALGVGCDLFQADLSDSVSIAKMLEQIFQKKDAVDVLVNSASLFYKTPLKNAKESDWDALINANLKGPFLLSRQIGTRMAKREGGKIVNIADWSGFRPYRDYAPYCVSKGGLITLTKALARDLAPKVQVNAVAPGPVLLPPDLSEEEKEAIIRKTPLGRIGTPQDVAYAVRFLLENDFINGAVLVVDGGRSIV